MFKLNIFRITYFIAALLCVSHSTSALSTLLGKNKVASRSEDLDLTRELIMKHFNKVDSGKGVVMEVIEMDDIVADDDDSIQSTTRSVRGRMASYANTAAKAPKKIVNSISIDPIKSKLVGSIKKSMKNRKTRRAGSSADVSFAPISFVGRRFDARNLVSIKAVEKKSLALVSLISRVVSLGQLEIIFD